MPELYVQSPATIIFMLKPISLLLHSFLILVLIGTFSSIIYYTNNEPGAAAAAMSTPALVPTPPGTIEFIPDAGWSMIQPGLEKRVMEIYNDQNQFVETLHIWRVDQRFFRLDVAYDDRPKSLDAWQSEMNAAIIVNGGYYSIDGEKYFPDGLTIVNGKAFGRSFTGRGGMLTIDRDRAELRGLAVEPYNPSEPLQAALQSFPILVESGGGLGYGPERETYAQARRTVIAQDKEGRILFLVAPQGYFTLHQLSLYLTESDLNLDIAVNLDGGGSTGILVANPREIISPTRPLPFVILVYPR